MQKFPIIGGWTNPVEKYARQIGSWNPKSFGVKIHPKMCRNHLVPYFKPPEVDITWVFNSTFLRKKNILAFEVKKTSCWKGTSTYRNSLQTRFLRQYFLENSCHFPASDKGSEWVPRKGCPKRPSWNYRPFLLGVQFFSRSHRASSLGAISSTFLLEKVEQLRHDHYCCFMFMAVQRVTTNPLVETTTPNEWLVCHWLLGSKLLHN